MSEQPQSSDGLVMPDAFPVKAADIKPSEVSAAGEGLKSMGSTIDSKMDSIVSLWGGLPGMYVVPEGEAVYGLMGPAASASDQVREALVKAGEAVVTYSEALPSIKSTLETLEKDASSFRERALQGRDGKKWTELQDMVDENKALLGRYASVVESLTTASSACANTVNGLRTDVCLPPVEAISAEAIMSSGEAMPWGAPVEKDRNCGESVVHGAGNFLKSTWDGAKAMVGVGEDGWSLSNLGKTWLGVADFVGSTVLLASPVLSGAIKFVGGDSVDAWVDRRHDVAMTAWCGMVNYDYAAAQQGGDGWHKWKEDGVAAFTEAVLNVGTAFIPGAGQVGAGLKVAMTGAKGASMVVKGINIASNIADMAIPGGSWLAKGGVRVANGVTDVVGLTDNAAGAAAKVTPNPVALGRNAPVSEALDFGGGRAGVPAGSKVDVPAGVGGGRGLVAVPDLPEVPAGRGGAPTGGGSGGSGSPDVPDARSGVVAAAGGGKPPSGGGGEGSAAGVGAASGSRVPVLALDASDASAGRVVTSSGGGGGVPEVPVAGGRSAGVGSPEVLDAPVGRGGSPSGGASGADVPTAGSGKPASPGSLDAPDGAAAGGRPGRGSDSGAPKQPHADAPDGKSPGVGEPEVKYRPDADGGKSPDAEAPGRSSKPDGPDGSARADGEASKRPDADGPDARSPRVGEPEVRTRPDADGGKSPDADVDGHGQSDVELGGSKRPDDVPDAPEAKPDADGDGVGGRRDVTGEQPGHKPDGDGGSDHGDVPEGKPTHDPAGRPFHYDENGRAHVEKDPPGSFRDENGALHDSDTGNFKTDTNKPQVDGFELAEFHDSVEVDIDPDIEVPRWDETGTTFAEDVAARKELQLQHLDDLHARNALAEAHGIEPKGLTKSKFRETIRQAMLDGRIPEAKAEELLNLTIDEADSADVLRGASEVLGERATDTLMAADGMQHVFEPSGKTGPGKFDRVGLGGEPPSITFYESKGGDSALGSRKVDGVDCQQGSTTYLNKIAELDTRYIDGIRDYLAKTDPADPVAQAIRDGSIEIKYTLVQAKPNGTVVATPFKIDPTRLNLPKP